MSTTSVTTDVLPRHLDVTRLALASFLARYRETLTAYRQDLAAFLGWCERYDVQPLRVTRGQLEIYLRHLQQRGYAPATIARRFGTFATFYKYAVIDNVIPANPCGGGDPAQVGKSATTPPSIEWPGPAMKPSSDIHLFTTALPLISRPPSLGPHRT